jgi:hypothetical protein
VASFRELALDHAAGRPDDHAYLGRLKDLRVARDAVGRQTAGGIPAQRAIEWLRALGQSVSRADAPEEKADLVHAIYDRIVVAGSTIESVRLTPAA